MKESIGFVVVTYGMGKLQKTAKPQTFETLLGNGARSFSVKVMGCFFVKTLTLTYILFPYISFLLFHLYLYFWFYDGLFGFFLETETPFPSHLLKTAYAQKGSWGSPPVPGLRLRFGRFPPRVIHRCAMRVAFASGDCVFQGWYVEVADPSSPDVWIVRVDLKSRLVRGGAPMGCPRGPHGLWLGVKKTANGNALHPNKFPPFSRNELLLLYVKSIWSWL